MLLKLAKKIKVWLNKQQKKHCFFLLSDWSWSVSQRQTTSKPIITLFEKQRLFLADNIKQKDLNLFNYILFIISVLME